jgi:hypothetical protein
VLAGRDVAPINACTPNETDNGVPVPELCCVLTMAIQIRRIGCLNDFWERATSG